MSSNRYATIEQQLTGGQQQRDLFRLLCESPPIANQSRSAVQPKTKEPLYIRNAVRLLTQVDEILAEHAAWPPLPKSYNTSSMPSVQEDDRYAKQNYIAKIRDINSSGDNKRSSSSRNAKSPVWASIGQNYYVKHLALSLANLLFVCVMAIADFVQIIRNKSDATLERMCRQLRAEYERHSMPGVALRSPAVLALCVGNGTLRILDGLLGGLMKLLLPHTGYKI